MGKKHHTRKFAPFGGATMARVMTYVHTLASRGTKIRVNFLYWSTWDSGLEKYRVRIFDLFNQTIAEGLGKNDKETVRFLITFYLEQFEDDYEFVRFLLVYQARTQQYQARFVVYLQEPYTGNYHPDFLHLLEREEWSKRFRESKRLWMLAESRDILRRFGDTYDESYLTSSKTPDHAWYRSLSSTDLWGLLSEVRFIHLMNKWIAQKSLPCWVKSVSLASYEQDHAGIDAWIQCSDYKKPIPVQIKSTYTKEEYDQYLLSPRFLVPPLYIKCGFYVPEHVIKEIVLKELSRFRKVVLNLPEKSERKQLHAC